CSSCSRCSSSARLVASEHSLSILACRQCLVVGVISVGDSSSCGGLGSARTGSSGGSGWLCTSSRSRSGGGGFGSTGGGSLGCSGYARLGGGLVSTLVLVLLLLLAPTSSHHLDDDGNQDERGKQQLPCDAVHTSVARIVHTIYDIDDREQGGACQPP
ncbi:hypothetical protein PENTCL1PPCAC_11990, partial [Pristionchus entomophagus]